MLPYASRSGARLPGIAGVTLLFAALLAAARPASAQADRFFRPTEGFTLAKDLPEDFTAVARSIQLDIKDVFDGSTAHSDAEEMMFGIGNRLHIETRAGTLRRRLLSPSAGRVKRDPSTLTDGLRCAGPAALGLPTPRRAARPPDSAAASPGWPRSPPCC